jgi:hypothetical protein
MLTFLADDTTSHTSCEHVVNERRVIFFIELPIVNVGNFIGDSVLFVEIKFLLDLAQKSSEELLAIMLGIRLEE